MFYGNLAWEGTYSTTLDRLRVLQKRVIRIITKSEPYAHTTPLSYEYRLPDIVNIHLLQVGLFMFLFSKNCYQNPSIQCLTKALRYIVIQPEMLTVIDHTGVEQISGSLQFLIKAQLFGMLFHQIFKVNHLIIHSKLI